jgi:hypothetical protein
METVKKATAKKKLIDDNFIISKYMDSVLENNLEPKNVFLFCKDNKIVESEFYSFYGSLDAVKQDIWVKFFENAISTIEKEEAFASYSDKNKLLTLYFTLFEILTLNRSYVLFSLKENDKGIQNLKNLKLFRNQFKDFIVTIIESNSSENIGKIKKIAKPVFSEGAWIQFLFLLKFWIDDTSKEFEKTDVLIEKSVNTVVDLLDTKPLESLLDLGKFLWKENR